MTETKKPISTRKDLEARIIANAWRDPVYKARLLKDPKSVLIEELSAIDPSIKLPDALTVAVHEEAQNTFHLVLPRNPRDIALSEVTGEDLEAIAPQTIAVILVAAVGMAVTVAVAANATAGANVNAVYNVNVQATINTV